MLQFLYPPQQIIVHHFFWISDGRDKSNNSGLGGKALFFLQVSDSTQALLNQHF